MTHWEYKVETMQVGGTMHLNLDQMTDDWLNQFGAEGWELVSTTTLTFGGTDQRTYWVFKRPIE